MKNIDRFYTGQETLEVGALERRGREISRWAAAQGMVLLENDGVLPLKAGARLGLFGVGARHTIKGGTGSGDVNSRDVVSVDAGLREAGFEIVNTDYLDAYDAAYARARDEWERAIYAATEGKRDSEKLYSAHARLTPKLPEDQPLPEADCKTADALIYVLSRVSGEGADRRDEPGDYYLSAREREELTALCGFQRPVVVVLNIGGPIDLDFMDELPISALVLMSQAGVEGGGALADVLSGKINPSGRLTDTYAYRYEDYPSSAGFSHRNGNLIEEYYTDGIYVGYRYFDTFGVKPRYPFGFGRSYTRFEQRAKAVGDDGSEIWLDVDVRNVGERAGREVAQLYVACPASEQLKEFKRLAAFSKTDELAPGESQTLRLRFDASALASWREGESAYCLEKGVYTLLLGRSAEDCDVAARLTLGETATLERLGHVCELLDALDELRPDPSRLAARDAALSAREAALAPLAIDGAVQAAMAKLNAPKTSSLDPELLSRARRICESLSEEEKVRLTVGAPSAMSGEIIGAAALTVPGAAGETVALPDRGVPKMVLADGPAGIRLQMRYEIDPESGNIYRLDRFETLENRFFGKLTRHEGAKERYQFATAIPIGTLLAQSFDTALVEAVGEHIARELKAFGVAVWLAPGMNIHRNPLCGRNFEYFSEDPLLSGFMAAAMTRGVQRAQGVGVTIKHYACNNQEDNRFHVTAVISERALREIYLKGFEIAVKTAQPMSIMTSYNRINGVHAANSDDLCTRVARQEWGFEGFIMTDWTTTNGGHGSSAAKCLRAGNDLVMPGRESDRREIMEALHGEGRVRLAPRALDECAVRLIYAALSTAAN